ncbi:MAG: hypothetical protein FJ128_07595 [Deltaproteobacteria bacterium]|nr:hypothetical protein [Deltaproteobacteria bacterium]
MPLCRFLYAMSRGLMTLGLTGVLLLAGAPLGGGGLAGGLSAKETLPTSPEPEKEIAPPESQPEPQKTPANGENGAKKKKKKKKKGVSDRYGGGTIRGVTPPADKEK